MNFLTKLFGKKDVAVAPSTFTAKAKTTNFSARTSFVADGYKSPSTRPAFNDASDHDSLYDFHFGRFYDGAASMGTIDGLRL